VLASIDTCFLIDWSRYRNRFLLTRLFDRLLVSEHVLSEAESEGALSFITEMIGDGLMYLVPTTSEEDRIVHRLVMLSLNDSRIPEIHETEAYTVAIALSYNAVVLTENKAVLWLKVYHPEVISVPVWRSIDVLVEAVIRGLISINDRDDFIRVLNNFTEDTHHLFSEVDIERALRRLRL